MKLNQGLHLAYCTNIHRGETWPETFDSLKNHSLAVRKRVCPRAPFAIGLRLSHRAAVNVRAVGEVQSLIQFHGREKSVGTFTRER